MGNRFKTKWDSVEKPETFPTRYSGKTISMDFEELKAKVNVQEEKFVNNKTFLNKFSFIIIPNIGDIYYWSSSLLIHHSNAILI